MFRWTRTTPKSGFHSSYRIPVQRSCLPRTDSSTGFRRFRGALLHGGRLVVVPFRISRSPQEFRTLLAWEGVTILNQTPSAWRQFLRTEEDPSGNNLNLRLVIFAGEALEMSTLKPWFERHGDVLPQLVNMYGITETTVHVTYRPLRAEDARRAISPIGVPIPDLWLHVLDE